MIHDLSTSAVLNESGELVRRTTRPWLGLLWLSALPLRLLQVHFIDRVFELDDAASNHVGYLHGNALLICAAFILSLYGRAVYVRACRLTLEGGRPLGWEALRLPATSVNYVYLACLLEVLSAPLLITLFGYPIVVLAAGVAAATFELNDRPSLVQPLIVLSRFARPSSILLALLFVFSIALVLAYVNLFALFQALLWLADGVVGLDLVAWRELLGFGNSRFRWLLLAGAVLAVEPFWLAASVAFVSQHRARQSGDDLRRWFATLRAEAGA